MELLAPTNAKCIVTQRGDVVSSKKLCDMTEIELRDILTNRRYRVSQNLVNQVWDELERRGTNSTIQSARADTELREEIIEAIMAEGKSRHVAENFTNTEAKMLAEGKRLGII
jgi:hypothetical protein